MSTMGLVVECWRMRVCLEFVLLQVFEVYHSKERFN